MQRKRLLLVEDSATVLMLERIFLRPDYDLIMATDGRTGVAKAIAERPDLIVLDVVLPGINGLTVCKALRAEEALRTTPILMVTCQNDPRVIEAGFQSGCTDYITKPIDGGALRAAVKRCLGEAGSLSAAAMNALSPRALASSAAR